MRDCIKIECPICGSNYALLLDLNRAEYICSDCYQEEINQQLENELENEGD